MAADAHASGQQTQGKDSDNVHSHGQFGATAVFLTVISEQQRGKGQSGQQCDNQDFHNNLLLSGSTKIECVEPSAGQGASGTAAQFFFSRLNWMTKGLYGVPVPE